MESESEEPQPSTSNQTQNVDSELDVDKELNRLLTVEEFLIKSKTYLLEYEKHMFLDTIDSDCLVVGARLVSNIAVFSKYYLPMIEFILINFFFHIFQRHWL